MSRQPALSQPCRPGQRGVVAVEFALLMMFILVPLLLFMIEVGRYMFLVNTMQESARRGARLAVVSWTDKAASIKSAALFGGSDLPAGAEVTASQVSITYLNAAGNTVTTLPTSPGDNLSACADAGRTAECIYAVNVTISGVTYSPMFLKFSGWAVPMRAVSVTMHAESLGFND